jgi:hypothetical protein
VLAASGHQCVVPALQERRIDGAVYLDADGGQQKSMPFAAAFDGVNGASQCMPWRF